MLQLIISLDKKNNLLSKETNSGEWSIYLNMNGQKSKVEEKHFSSYDMEDELEKAVKALNEWNKKVLLS